MSLSGFTWPKGGKAVREAYVNLHFLTLVVRD